MFEILNKVALITGGASGIGLSIAKALLENGVKGVAIADVNEHNGKLVLESIHAQYGANKAIFVKLDVSDRNQFHDAFNITISAFKNLDIVINSAGVVLESAWEKEIATNLTGTVTGTVLAVEDYLPKHKTGADAVVINVASIFGLETYSCLPVYSATKHGVVGLTKSFGTKLHYERNKVRVMVICPNFTTTPLIQFTANTYLKEEYSDLFAKEFPMLTPQNIDNVSKAMIQMINEGENGSAWVTEDDLPPYEVEFLNRQQSKKIKK